MSSIYVIGDALLAKCYEKAKDDSKCLNFDNQNVQCVWETDIQQTEAVEEKYKDLFSKNAQPDMVVILCGSYDLLLNKNPKDASDKLLKLTQYILSTGVKHIIVCSIIDRYEDKVPCEVNRFVKFTNRRLAKLFKKNEHIYFLHIRPLGKTNDLWDSDHSNLKGEGYRHIYERIKTTVHKLLVPNLNSVAENTVPPISAAECTKKDITEDSVEPVSTITLTDGVPIAKRMMESEDVSQTDNKRICTEEKQLTAESNEIQRKLEETDHKEEDIESTL